MAYETKDGQVFYSESEAQAHANALGAEERRMEALGAAAEARRIREEEEERQRQARIKAYVAKAEECRNKGDLDGAISAYYNAVKERATSYYRTIAEIYVQKGDLDRAIMVLLEAVNKAGDKSHLGFIGDIYLKKGDKSEAAEYYALHIETLAERKQGINESQVYFEKAKNTERVASLEKEASALYAEGKATVKKWENLTGRKYYSANVHYFKASRLFQVLGALAGAMFGFVIMAALFDPGNAVMVALITGAIGFGFSGAAINTKSIRVIVIALLVIFAPLTIRQVAVLIPSAALSTEESQAALSQLTGKWRQSSGDFIYLFRYGMEIDDNNRIDGYKFTLRNNNQFTVRTEPLETFRFTYEFVDDTLVLTDQDGNRAVYVRKQ